MRKRGFTLIELLVVVAVMAIIAALLFPTFAQARDKARQAACLSNMKQLAMGVMMYTQDYEETLPKGSLGFDPTGAHFPWPLTVAPYVKNTAIFRCPSDRKPMSVKAWLSSGIHSRYPDFPLSIICNYNVLPPYDLDSVRLAEYVDASRIIALCDMRDMDACPGWTGQWGVLPFRATIRQGLYGRQLLTGEQVRTALDQCEQRKPQTGEGSKFAPRVATGRHTGGANYIFLDGHAKWMCFRQTLNPEGGTEGSMWVQVLMRHVPY
jgi:prepilin-type N-terminal cleavage/methylation domain-containing protein/prepilin-type processing-associated H-X9-DG protein